MELRDVRRFRSPGQAQDFLNSLPFNFEEGGETLKSPLRTLREGNAHCMEGALLGAYILSLQGFPPLILRLEARRGDFHHIIAPFEVGGLWGALSKTNHSVLRFREPIYRDIRELCISYFHEYFLDSGHKTLRRYSAPLNLKQLGREWIEAEKDLWFIDKAIKKLPHFDFAPHNTVKRYRLAEHIEILGSNITEYKSNK